jgi:hypothetical protein
MMVGRAHTTNTEKKYYRMASGNYFYITALPNLGDLGEKPPIKLAEVLSFLADQPSLRAIASVIFLQDDLLQREGFLAGEEKVVSPTVLTTSQVQNVEPLPESLISATTDEPSRSIQADTTWELYFRYVAEIAQNTNNKFLARWVRFEVSLRNAVVIERSKRLGLDASRYLVATELGESGADFRTVISEWSAASSPLAGHRVLTSARWQWLRENDAWFTFENDEFAAYAAKLMLLHQWHRLIEAETGAKNRTAAGESSENGERTTQ